MLRIGCAAVISWIAASLVVASVAAATPPTPTISIQQTSPLQVQLASSTGTRWSWTVVDASNTVVGASTENPANLIFAAPGDYTVLLDASDDDPLLTTPAHAQARFHVRGQSPPVVDLNIMSSPAAVNSPVLLDASRSTDPDQDPLTFSWDLDGNGTFGDGTGALQIVSYPTAGRYLVAVAVSDARGAVSTAQASILVLADQAPLVSFANDPLQPIVGAVTTFTATASDPDGTVVHIAWDLDDDGDFDDAAGPWATWSFDVAGGHRVAVRATDDRGVASVAFRRIIVGNPILTSPTDQPQATIGSPSPTSSVPGAAIPNAPAPSSDRIALMAPFPVIRIRGLIYRDAVRINLFRVQAPPGATIRVRCRGKSCVTKRPDVRVRAAREPVRVRRFEGRRLDAGTVIEVFVTAPNRIGKYTRFTVRKGASPARSDLCLRPGQAKPTTCPST